MEALVRTELVSGVATIRMDRPALHNALDDAMIAGLTEALAAVNEDPAARVVVLTGAGKSFSAGADLDWMRRMAEATEAENLAGARRLARLLRALDGLGKPTVARVHGATFGGGVGLVAACDVAIAADEAIFALSEARLGLIPAVISPYVVAAIGARHARRLFLTAERLVADEARQIGLVHRVVAAGALDAAVDETVVALKSGGPAAQAAAKRLVADVAGRPIDEALIEETASRIAKVRSSSEGREGVAAFLEKRKPRWADGG